MGDHNLVLVAGTYPDRAAAVEDFKALQDARRAEAYIYVGAVVISRDEQGHVTVDEHGRGEILDGTVFGAMGGLILGLLAPPLLLTTAMGAGIGIGIGGLVKRHHEQKMGVDVEQWVPVGMSVVVALVDEGYARQVKSALVRAEKTTTSTVDPRDLEAVKEALAKAGHEVTT